MIVSSMSPPKEGEPCRHALLWKHTLPPTITMVNEGIHMGIAPLEHGQTSPCCTKPKARSIPTDPFGVL